MVDYLSCDVSANDCEHEDRNENLRNRTSIKSPDIRYPVTDINTWTNKGPFLMVDR